MAVSSPFPSPFDIQPGAIPPTGGVAPEDAPPASSAPASARAARDELVDGIELIRRAARRALGALDPRIERAAENAVERLRALDADAPNERRSTSSKQLAELSMLVEDFGREVASVIERVAKRLEVTATR